MAISSSTLSVDLPKASNNVDNLKAFGESKPKVLWDRYFRDGQCTFSNCKMTHFIKTSYYNVKEYLRAKHIKQIVDEWGKSTKQIQPVMAKILRPSFKFTPSTDAMSKEFRKRVVSALTETCLPLAIVESEFINTIIYEAVRVYSLRNTIPTNHQSFTNTKTKTIPNFDLVV